MPQPPVSATSAVDKNSNKKVCRPQLPASVTSAVQLTQFIDLTTQGFQKAAGGNNLYPYKIKNVESGPSETAALKDIRRTRNVLSVNNGQDGSKFCDEKGDIQFHKSSGRPDRDDGDFKQYHIDKLLENIEFDDWDGSSEKK